MRHLRVVPESCVIREGTGFSRAEQGGEGISQKRQRQRTASKGAVSGSRHCTGSVTSVCWTGDSMVGYLRKSHGLGKTGPEHQKAEGDLRPQGATLGEVASHAF